MYVPVSIKIVVRPDKKNKKGLLPIVLQFIQNRKKNNISLSDLEQKEGVVFPNMLTNQKSNVYLKEIIARINCSKHISFHCSRHSFACVALNQGIPKEVVQKMLGHSSSEMTSNYTKVQDNYVVLEMKKWKQGITRSETDYKKGLSETSLAAYKKLRIKVISTRIASGFSEGEIAEQLGILEEDYVAMEKGEKEFGVAWLIYLGEVLGRSF